MNLASFHRYKGPALISALRANGCRYVWDAKATPITLQPNEIHALDCSGCSRYLLFHMGMDYAGIPEQIPDGSVQQHDWARNHCAYVKNLDAPLRNPDVLYIAFLPPVNNVHPGHVMLIQDGMTLESHGGVGPSRRPWLSEPFMAHCQVYAVGNLQ